MKWLGRLLWVGFLMGLLRTGQATGSNRLPVQSPHLGSAIQNTPVNYLPVISKRGLVPSIYGLEMTESPTISDLQYIEQAGVSTIRRNGVEWAAIEPVQGQRDWGAVAYLEDELSKYASVHRQVVLIVRKTPAWAQSSLGSTCGPIKPSALGAFASFMHDLVVRYSQPQYNVVYWEIWNEPDVAVHTNEWFFGCWGDPQDSYFGGGYYAEMLKYIYPAIKSANPQAQVVIGGLLLGCNPDKPPAEGCLAGKFFEGILRNNGAKYFDGVAFHTYDYYTSNYRYENPKWGTSNTGISITRAKLDFLQGVAARYNVTGKYYLNSETALLCMSTCDAGFESTKADRLASNFAEALVLELRVNSWYDLTGTWHNTALLINHSVTPAYLAYIESHSELAGGQYIRKVNQPGVTGYEFKTFRFRVWVVWSTDGLVHPYQLNAIPYAVLDVYGNPLSISSSLSISQSPVYIRWVP